LVSNKEIVGIFVGIIVGILVGTVVGLVVGTVVGLLVGLVVGTVVGLLVGLVVGTVVGLLVGVGIGIHNPSHQHPLSQQSLAVLQELQEMEEQVWSEGSKPVVGLVAGAGVRFSLPNIDLTLTPSTE